MTCIQKILTQDSRGFKARVHRAKQINRATMLLVVSTLGMVAGYLVSTIGKGV
jgi:hypothetical protein